MRRELRYVEVIFVRRAGCGQRFSRTRALDKPRAVILLAVVAVLVDRRQRERLLLDGYGECLVLALHRRMARAPLAAHDNIRAVVPGVGDAVVFGSDKRHGRIVLRQGHAQSVAREGDAVVHQLAGIPRAQLHAVERLRGKVYVLVVHRSRARAALETYAHGQSVGYELVAVYLGSLTRRADYLHRRHRSGDDLHPAHDILDAGRVLGIVQLGIGYIAAVLRARVVFDLLRTHAQRVALSRVDKPIVVRRRIARRQPHLLDHHQRGLLG